KTGSPNDRCQAAEIASSCHPAKFAYNGTLMLQVVNLSKSYGSQLLFDRISFSMVKGERLGLVGRNGAGKSTLFRILLGEESSDSGEVITPRGYTFGHLAQHISFTESTVLAEACLGLPRDERDQTYRAEIILSGLGFSEEDM